MRFIHTADLHLGAAPDKDKPWGPARADAVRQSLPRLVELCNQESVDLLLIAGDLFHRPPTEAELKETDYLFSQLTLTKVVLIAGNHDFLRPGCAMAEHVFPENVFFISSPDPETVRFPQWNLEVTGFSYYSEQLRQDLTKDLVCPKDDKRHILMLHGGDAEHLPFKLGALQELGWDYIALGHIHKPSISADGRAAMPGSPEPLDKTETGPHGFYEGSLTNGAFSLSWRNFSNFEYTDLKINLTPDTRFAALESLLKKRLKPDGSEVCRLFLSGRRDPDADFDRDALSRLGFVSEVIDESQPDFPWEDWAARPAHDILARLTAALTPSEDDPEAALKQKALVYAAEALLSTVKRPGEEVLR
ncbi:MAG: DNA repair exonuclease [Lachnospiraceae bacterium]|nr:DNA repair exonuclease [Lachnospiraceae bacterium]